MKGNRTPTYQTCQAKHSNSSIIRDVRLIDEFFETTEI